MTPASSDPWVPPAPEDVARWIPNYEVLSLLGRGGMGAVYLGLQTALDRPVAIKLLPLEISADREFTERFVREARALARMNHPNVVSVYDFGTSREGHLFFAMELVDGSNLQQALGGKGMDPTQVLAIAVQICRALAYAHGQGVIHRDIKPANILLDRDGRAKVADFGLARQTDPEAGNFHTTATSLALGTVDYMAPEQKKGGPVDARADIYSLGVMLYQMLCGEVPQGAFAPPSQRIACSVELDRIVLKALQPAPERRYQRLEEMQADLESLQQRLPAVATKPGRARGGSHRWIWAAVGAAVLAAATSFFWGPRVVGVRATFNQPPETFSSAVQFASATRERPYVNSLGMQFVPVPVAGGPSGGQRVLFSIWETRNCDYERFLQRSQTSGSSTVQPALPSMEAEKSVSWEDARNFCGWLTQQERASGELDATLAYRLPTDHEWSCAVGIGDQEDPGQWPNAKGQRNTDLYPWGRTWPPPENAGNYGGEELQGDSRTRHLQVIRGYRDPFVWVAPVGTFPPNTLGLHDLGGNVREWCEDLYEPGLQPRVLRGASYSASSSATIASASRRFDSPASRNGNNGFRVVLARGEPPEMISEEGSLRSPSEPQILDGHRYQFIPGALSWAEAKAQAEQLGGHLATIASAREQKFVARLADPYLRAEFHSAWLGAIRSPVGSGWVWVTGEPFVFADWSTADPRNAPAGSWLALVRTSGMPLMWTPYEADSPARRLMERVRGYIVEWEGEGMPAETPPPAVNPSK